MTGPINIDHGNLPGDNMHPDTIDAAADGISKVGGNVSKKGATVQTTWQGLAHSYHAPEQNTLLHAMNPAKKAAEDFGDDMTKVCSALKAFASEVRTIKAEVTKIRADAASFNAGIHDGKVTITEHHVMNRAQLEMGQSDTTHKDVDWKSDYATVQQHNELIRRAGHQKELLWAAERKCANAIRDLYGAKHIYAISESHPNGYGLDDIPDNVSNLMPWGNTIDVKEGCGDKAADGVMNTALNGVGGFIGFHYAPGTALAPEQAGFSWSTFGHHYEGLAQLATGLTNPATPALAFLPGPVGRWFNASTEAQSDFLPGLVGIDLYNHNPNHHWATDWNHDPLYNWKTNPAGTAGSVGFNLATLAIPGPKGLGALTKGSKAARATEEGGTLAKGTRAADDLTDLTKTTAERADLTKSITGASKSDLGNLTKTTDLDKTVKGLDNLNKYDDFDVHPNGLNTHHTNPGADADAPPPRTPEDPADAGPGQADHGHTPDGTKPTHSGDGKPYDPDAPVHDTVPAKDAPHPHYTPKDVQKALDDAPVNEHGQPVDPRTGEPLRLERSDGTRGWEMRWDGDENQWVAQNHGSGYSHGMPDHGTPNTFGYDEHGKLMPYANHRPDYADGQVQEVWRQADTDGDGIVRVLDKDDNLVEIHWDGTSPRDGLWDMGHMPDAKYSEMRDRYLNHEMSKEDFLHEYQKPDNYRVEHPSRNRSHVDE